LTDVSTLLSRFSSCQPTFRRDTAAISAFAILHVAGLVIMALTEVGLIAKAA